MIIFITGGVRSGKSTFALQVAERKVEKSGVIHYIATSTRSDIEMDDRINRHIEERQMRDKRYVTHEKSTHIEKLMVHFKEGDAVILDCLTGLVTAEFFCSIDQGIELWKESLFQQQLLERLSDTFMVMQQSPIPCIVVTNELFDDIIPNDKSTIAYLKLMGRIHQKIVSICTQAYLVEAGIPLLKKDVEVR
ncbi:bifunctional adenosylcobinamide kinase/adenosylcobinamide-phosphate guanylyltransferase [Alkalihalobacterium elongatum]|uniref:bifunctional adenosylcobinamide kinase/adenosylcobinamide-phosphate guanylyltransferase n=1 Tax=Alkalihalobacterium elongatum TaxID=2675466 RepID=UPI001C1FC860|nr:bifunctional adenosylcobinamide kinase/adenosylcobinamide-phosphate guanylyltransferase [Alkalihalobacterium elongatum]